jgi:hypothetical protein
VGALDFLADARGRERRDVVDGARNAEQELVRLRRVLAEAEAVEASERQVRIHPVVRNL